MSRLREKTEKHEMLQNSKDLFCLDASSELKEDRWMLGLTSSKVKKIVSDKKLALKFAKVKMIAVLVNNAFFFQK